MKEEIIDSWSMLEVKLTKDEDFLTIKETLERIGLTNDEDNELTQLCYIFQKRNNYYITHLKEMLVMDGVKVDITNKDMTKRNTIALLLQQWNLLKVLTPISEEFRPDMYKIKIVKFDDKDKWSFISNYDIGNIKG